MSRAWGGVEGAPEEDMLQGVSYRADVEHLATRACGVVVGVGAESVRVVGEEAVACVVFGLATSPFSSCSSEPPSLPSPDTINIVVTTMRNPGQSTPLSQPVSALAIAAF